MSDNSSVMMRNSVADSDMSSVMVREECSVADSRSHVSQAQ